MAWRSKWPIRVRKGAAMDVPNIDTMAQQWGTFLSAPYIILPPAIILAGAAWWFRGTMFQSTISGLKAEIAGLREQINVFGAQKTIFDAQMQLAEKELAFERTSQDSLARQFNDFKVDITAGAGIDTLTARVAGLETSLKEIAVANNAVRSAIGIAVGTLAATEIGDSFSNTPLGLQAEADKEGPK
jgi:hypothetical protein